MISIKLDQFKKGFFVPSRISNAAEKAEKRALGRVGAIIRLTARRSIRSRKRSTSSAGQPPFSKTGLLRRFIMYGLDPSGGNLVVGPLRLNQKRGDVPSLLEFGGTRFNPIKKRMEHYEPRPYMRPALDANLSKIPAQWRNSLPK